MPIMYAGCVFIHYDTCDFTFQDFKVLLRFFIIQIAGILIQITGLQ